jgi:four helix bundle protein
MTDDLGERLTALAIRVMKLCDSLPRTRSANVIANQLLRAGTSSGAQYCEGQHSRSVAESISKLQSSLQELEETRYWLDLIVRHRLMREERLAPLRKEVKELTAILVACVKKLKARRR